MRPVNLIPSNERRGDSAEARTGPVAYMVIGGLVAALAGVSVLTLTGNEISDRKTELASLKAEHAVEQERAEALAAYTQFRAVRDTRTATIASLADSRFDWERVLRELALVMPSDVWLTELKATVAPAVTLDGGTEVAGREAVTGPALELIGCAPGQEAVARFISVIKDIGGVTRVGVPSSTLPGGGTEGGGACQTRDFIAEFQMIVAFDAVPAAAAAAPTTVAPPVDPATATPTAAEGG